MTSNGLLERLAAGCGAELEAGGLCRVGAEHVRVSGAGIMLKHDDGPIVSVADGLADADVAAAAFPYLHANAPFGRPAAHFATGGELARPRLRDNAFSNDRPMPDVETSSTGTDDSTSRMTGEGL